MTDNTEHRLVDRGGLHRDEGFRRNSVDRGAGNWVKDSACVSTTVRIEKDRSDKEQEDQQECDYGADGSLG